MQLVFSLSFVKLLGPLVRFISYSHDQDHVHVHHHMLHFYTGSQQHIHSYFHQIRTPCHHMTSLSHKVRQRIWGYAKRNTRCILKKGMPHALACSKIKDAYPKKVCHMPTSHVKKKIAPIQRKKKKQERWFIQRSSSIIHHPPKNTHIYTLAHLDQGL